jgi:hypothetical protein
MFDNLKFIFFYIHFKKQLCKEAKIFFQKWL